MKLVFLFLVAVCCSALGIGAKKDNWKNLCEAQKFLAALEKDQLSNTKKLSSPPDNIEEHCCSSALKCFQVNLKEHFNTTAHTVRLGKSLRRIDTIFSQNFSNSGNNTTTCDVCNTHPEVNVQEFLNRLKSLIQRAVTKVGTK